MSENIECVVVVERVLSQMERGCIFTARRENGDVVRVKFAGRDTQPLAGDAFVVRGLLSAYQDRFGKSIPQIDSKQMKRATAQGHLLGPWLRRMPNIGPSRAQRLVEAFGHELPDVLRDTARMFEVTAVIDADRPALASRITAQLYAAMAMDTGAGNIRLAEVEFLTFLERLGIRESRIANQLWRFMAGADAVDRLHRNPYVSASLMDWKHADRVGQRLLRSVDSNADLHRHPARLAGALSSVWRELLADGDTAVTDERLFALLEERAVDAQATLRYAEDNGLLRRTGPLVRVPGAAWLEDQVTAALATMEQRTPHVSIPEFDALDVLVLDAEAKVGLRLTDEQHAAVVMLLTMPVAALQGGAGVGKTTVMKVLATAWEAVGGEVVMGALAGKAALTLSRGASSHYQPRLAYTTARLIGMLERQEEQDGAGAMKSPASDVSFTANTLLVIDEAGMMDTPSLYRLLRLLPNGARILFAGDQGQLPPVGIGKVFHDIVGEGSRVARLTKVLRQAEDSAIPAISTLIREGKTPVLESWRSESRGVYLVPTAELDAVQTQLRGHTELMVVAATRATVSSINETQSFKMRHSDTPTRRLGPLATVAVGDPVVTTANRYQDSLFNGLLGVVTSIDGPTVTVLWDGETEARALPREAEGDIELAYAITCHKAQGSSASVVLVVVERSALVTREWLYTALTRGRELVLLAGDAEGIEQAIRRRTSRITGFQLPPPPQIQSLECAEVR
ncbi:ATP-dependent DNA helicase [Burkholderia pseudomallei]|uniref:ATP-dependent DNA helicase n=1 Tax=Burkholderia pseudomallei TaxID=28450 RepID=UPI002ED8B11B